MFLSLLQATPYWDQSAVPVNVAKQKDPFIGKVLPRPNALKRRAPSSEGSHFMRAAARVPRPRLTRAALPRLADRVGAANGRRRRAWRDLQRTARPRREVRPRPTGTCVCLGNTKEAEGGRVVSDLLRGAGREGLTSLSPLISN